MLLIFCLLRIFFKNLTIELPTYSPTLCSTVDFNVEEFKYEGAASSEE